MGIKYFLYLYWRNLKGSVSNFFSYTRNTADSLTPAFAILLFPITLPLLFIGVATKTIIDYFTRKSVAETSISKTIAAINVIDDQQMDALSSHLMQYRAQSSSSKEILSILSEQQHLHKTQEVDRHAYDAKKIKLATDQLGSDAIEKYRPEYLLGSELDEEHQVLLDAFNAEQKQILIEQQTSLTRNLLTTKKQLVNNYMLDNKNNGKKLMQLIVGFFEVPVTKPNEKATIGATTLSS